MTVKNLLLTVPVCVHVKLLQSCLTLCDPTDHRQTGSSAHGILQARTVGRVAMPSSRGSSRPGNSPGKLKSRQIGKESTECFWKDNDLNCFLS